MTINTLKNRLNTYKVEKAKFELIKINEEDIDNDKIKNIEKTIKEVEILLSALTSTEMDFITCKYFEKLAPYDLMDKLNISEATVSRWTKRILNKMLELY